MGKTGPTFANNSERTLWYLEQKRLKRQKQKHSNRLKDNILKLDTKTLKREHESNQRQERRIRKREQLIIQREYERTRKHKWRHNNKDNTCEPCDYENAFTHRMEKKRALKRLKNALPKTPRRRSATLAAYLAKSSSPTVKTLQKANITVSPENRNENELAKQVLDNIATVVKDTKLKRSNDKLLEMNTVIASVSGENLTTNKVKTKLAARLGLPVKRISGGQRLRTKIITSTKSCLEYTKRKTRSDKVNDNTRKLIYDYWMSAGVSRPTGNKADVRRQRIGLKTYISHPLYILEKTQTEVYTEFKEHYTDISVSQRTFEKLKPFFVKPVRPKDKVTCCCRYHIEFNHAFKKCMAFRKEHLANCANGKELIEMHPVFEHSSDLLANTLCKKNVGQKYNKKECTDRNCATCGVKEGLFMGAELDESDSGADVEWEHYEYRLIKGKGTIMRRKLMLIKKATKVGTLFRHFSSLLETFPGHQYRAEWQSKQSKQLIEHLPEGDVVVVHDYSENYKCGEQKEIQSSYFQKTEVSIHVSILHRHAVLEYDGVQSVAEEPFIVQEQFFVISDDLSHDHHFTYHVEKLLVDYLSSISYPLNRIHEFTDGCASQYKSRHGFGSLTVAEKELHCKFVRNFYETSHAKGPQDAAGGLLKQQADYAILRGKVIIQTPRDFFEYVDKTLKQPKSNEALCKRRIFRYVEEIPRTSAKYFSPIPAIRSVHQVIPLDHDTILTRQLSCYCFSCIHLQFEDCEFSEMIGPNSIVKPKEQKTPSNEVVEPQDANSSIYELVNNGHIIAVKAAGDDEDYYLMRASTSTYTLQEMDTDDYHATHDAGTKVIEGNYFGKIGKSVLKYKLLKKHRALVPALSVVYICADIDDNQIIHMNEVTHRSILANL